MNQILGERLIQLIVQQTGFVIRPQDLVTLDKKIQARIKSLNLSGINAYYSLLNQAIAHSASDSHPTINPQSEAEWKILINMITNGESFFFRDEGQFQLLREQLLPQIIEAKSKANHLNLKIWSAGCSTGEEPYSIAMLLKELLPNLEQWQISILGTDINHQSIERARRGIYKNWSFRRITPYFQTKYFLVLPQGWELKPEIRRMVTFQFYNLTQDNFPDNTLIADDFDLILCRNVFIYWERKAVQQVVNKFYSSLRLGGFFIAGHAELQEIDLSQFLILSSPESVYYQRHENTTKQQTVRFASPGPTSNLTNSDISYPATTNIVNSPVKFTPINLPFSSELKSLQPIASSTKLQPQKPVQSPVKSELRPLDLQALETLLAQGQYAVLIQQAQELISQQPNYQQVYCLIAQAYANQGNLAQAIEYCERALTINALSVEPLYLLVQIAAEQNKLERAKELLKKIIYLEPNSIPAYLELGSLYSREGNLLRAKKMYDADYRLLQQLAPETEIAYQGKVTVGKLINHIKNLRF